MDTNLPSLNLLLLDILVKDRNKIRGKFEEDAACNSAFMFPAMNCVGTTIWKSYHLIPPSQKYYLVVDNATGHGTNEARIIFQKNLVIIIF